MSSTSALLATLLLIPASAFAGTCEPNPFNETYQNDGLVKVFPEGCGFQSSLTSSTNLTAAAVQHYRRQQPSSPLRLSFQVDLSELDGQSLTQAVSVAYGTSRNTVDINGRGVADLFRLVTFGGFPAQPMRQIGFQAACGACSSGSMFSTYLILDRDDPRIGIELEIGAGNDGVLRYWVDSDFDQAPTGTLSGLDNLAWQGVDRVGLGLSTARAAFLNDFADAVVTYSEVSSSDEWLYWAGFEGPGADQSPPAMPVSLMLPMSGNSCGSTTSLPAVASGSTATHSPVDVYAFTVDWARPFYLQLFTEQNLHAMYLCHAQSGPSAPCIAARSQNNSIIFMELAPGDYRILVGGVVPDACGSYSLLVTDP